MPKPKRSVIALSFGGGVQTTALALLLARGELTPKPHMAVFADTGAEPPHVYDTIDWIRPKLDYPLIVQAGDNLESDTLDLLAGKPTRKHPKPTVHTDMPAYSAIRGGGQVQRQCTKHYKIMPIRRAMVSWAGMPPARLSVTQLMGISFDEAMRIKPSGVNYIRNAYPLVDARWTRQDCARWLDAEYPGHPAGRSACYFCPYHSAAEWRSLKDRYPALWEKAKGMDAKLRERAQLTLFRRGLDARAIENQADFGAQWGAECEGHCGV